MKRHGSIWVFMTLWMLGREGVWHSLLWIASLPPYFVTCPRVRRIFLTKKLLMEGVKAHTIVYVYDFLVIADTHID